MELINNQIKDYKNYDKLTVETLEKLIQEMFKEQQEPSPYWTGIGGIIEFIEAGMKEHSDIDFWLLHINIESKEGTGLYQVGNLNKRKMNKALFLDLDGTIIKTKSGETFPKDISDWEFIPGILVKIRAYKDHGYNICIVANQGGIESGHIKKEDFETKIDTICKEIEAYIGGGVNMAWCGNMESYFRKPNPGMAYRLALELELSLRDSIMVGDLDSDAKFAKNAYIGTYLDIKYFLNNDMK